MKTSSFNSVITGVFTSAACQSYCLNASMTLLQTSLIFNSVKSHVIIQFNTEVRLTLNKAGLPTGQRRQLS